MISELGGRLPSTHSSRQPLRCAARVFVVAHHLLKRYLGALQPVVCQNHARQLRLLWSSIYRTLASLNLSCQLWLFEVLNRLGRWSAYGQTLLSGENSGSDQLIVVELIKRRTGQDMCVCMYVCMYVGSVHVAEWLGWHPTKGRTQVRYLLQPGKYLRRL